ncbi:MAG: octanoyltransferase, partial [Deltaproteobacteria bacterium]|nr:octanoyltransferase [Deltaproteobacteria bacterium]
MNVGPLEWCYLGRADYATALGLQRRLREAIRHGERRDVLLLLEHPPVITLGRSAALENIRAGAEELFARDVEVHRVGRGGEVTLHAPGQLVGYPLRR